MSDVDAIAVALRWEVGRKNARVLFISCIYHQEKTPSMCIWRSSERFYCHGCQESGTLAELIAWDTREPLELVQEDLDSGRWFIVSPGQLALPLSLKEKPLAS